MSTSSSFDYDKLYRLRDPLATRPLRLGDEGYSGEWITTHQAWLLAKGELKLDEPLRLGAYQGGQITDFLWSGLVPIVCISQRVVDLLCEQDITGWATYPVEVHDRQGALLPGYHGFAVIGAECRRDRSRSEIITKRRPTPQGREYQAYKGLYFQEDQWDGSDIFWIRHTGIIVVERVYKLFRSAKITNVTFMRLTEVEIDVLLDKYEKP